MDILRTKLAYVRVAMCRINSYSLVETYVTKFLTFQLPREWSTYITKKERDDIPWNIR